MSLLEMVKFLHQQGHSSFVVMPPSTDFEFINLLKPYVKSFLFIRLMPWNLMFINNRKIDLIKIWLYRLYKNGGGWLVQPYRIAKFIKKHQIDIVHTNTIMALDGAFAAWWTGIPHIQHLREITGKRPDAIYKMAGQQNAKWFGKYWGNLHSLLIANSNYTQNCYLDYIAETKIRVIPNAVEMATNMPIQKNFKVIGMVGNLTSKVKNHLLFIKISGLLLQRFPDLHFVIFGKIPAANNSYFTMLKSETDRSLLSKNLFFKGICTDQDEMYNQISILLHPYAYESFGRIYIEAMAHNVPVVAVRGGGADEIITHGKNGFLFDEAHLDDAVKHITALIEQPMLGKTITKNGFKFAESFQPQNVGTQLLETYKEVLS